MTGLTAAAEDLSGKRCFNHAGREAAARCPGCRRFYCRECVTEHDGRVLCAECLRRRAHDARAGGRLGRVVWYTVGLAGLAAAWA